MNTPTAAIRTLIVDDEPLGREGVRLLLKDNSAFTIVGESANTQETIAAVRKQKPDLLFLDISMPVTNGFDLLKQIPHELMPMVVFVTAHDQYAVPAFEVHALDYLLKPLNEARFALTLERIKTYVAERRQLDVTTRLIALLDQLQVTGDRGSVSSGENPRLQRIAIKNNDSISFVSVDDIDWIEATDYYATLHCGKQTHLIREAIKDLETRLNQSEFVRIHRSTIVRIDRIKELKRHLDGGYVVVLTDNTRLKLSRSYLPTLQSLIGKR